MTREQAFAKYVEAYKIDVPEEKVRELYDYFVLQMKHSLQYERMSGGPLIHPNEFIEERKEEILENAYREAKTDLVMKELLKDESLTVTAEELQEKAERMVKEENTSMDMVKRFFGDDLRGLERGVKEEKIKERIWNEMNQ